MTKRAGEWGFMIVWEFRARVGSEKSFEQVYGPRGRWTQFFSRGEGFIATELNRDLKDKARFVTLDLWVSESHYERFREQHAAEYEAIDRECEGLTEMEREIGRFESLL